VQAVDGPKSWEAQVAVYDAARASATTTGMDMVFVPNVKAAQRVD
jgi:hypothetical protein